MTERTLHDLTDDQLIDLLADLERVQAQAEELLLGRKAETKKARAEARACFVSNRVQQGESVGQTLDIRKGRCC